MVSQIGISMLVPIFLCAGLGYWLDHHFGTSFCFLLMLLLGIAASFRSVYELTKSFYLPELKKEKKHREYIEELKKYSETHPEEETDIEIPRKRYRDHMDSYEDTTKDEKQK